MTTAERTDRRREMAAAVKSGKDPDEVARKHGVTWNTVYCACRDHGVPVPRRAPNGIKPGVNAFAILKELIERPGADHFIAQRLGVVQSHVLYVRATARKAGWNV